VYSIASLGGVFIEMGILCGRRTAVRLYFIKGVELQMFLIYV
jgi:hypothetical protein